LSLNIFFPVHGRPLISIATYRGVLVEFPVKKAIAYDQNFRLAKSLRERIHIAFVTVPFQKEAWPWCQFLSLHFSFSIQARPLISTAIDRGVLLEPAYKKVMAYDKNF
jgi:hypothetical protein